MHFNRTLAALGAVSLLIPVAAQAQHGGWGYPDPFGPSALSRNDWNRAGNASRSDDREGRVNVARFVVQGAAAGQLGHGPVMVAISDETQAGPQRGTAQEYAPPQDTPAPTDLGPPNLGPPDSRAPRGDAGPGSTYEAAVIDQLVAAGYDTQAVAGAQDQQVELRLRRSVVQPQEAPHKPVSGEMEMGVSNRGSMMGMGINIDLTKPKKALIDTRMEVRIRSRAGGDVLWEGRADITTREGDSKWTDQAIAFKLAQSLFEGFPTKADSVALR